MLPNTVLLVFIMAVFPLIQSMIVRTCAEDRSRLPELLRSYHRLLILVLVPAVATGCIFMDKVVTVIAAQRGVDTGYLSMYLLPLNLIAVSTMPIITGVRVVERIQRLIIPNIIVAAFTVGSLVFALNFWPTFISLVVASYAIRIPATVFLTYISVRQVGGYYLPGKFLLRTLLSSSVVLLLLPLRWLWPIVEGWSRAIFGKPLPGSFAMLVFMAALALALLTFSARLFHLIGPDEIKYFRNAKIPGINFLMRLLVRRRYLNA